MVRCFDDTLGSSLAIISQTHNKIIQKLSETQKHFYTRAHTYYKNKLISLCPMPEGCNNYFQVEIPFSEQHKTNILNQVFLPFQAETLAAERGLGLYSFKGQIIEALRTQKVIILTADTGQGKSTQLPQYFFFHPYSSNKHIICTQPRKIAAVCMAKRVNFQLGWVCAESIVQNRNINISNLSRKILFFSEVAFLKLLLEQTYKSRPLADTKIVIVDEAHQRSLECEVILGIFKKYILPKRKDLRLVITSATSSIQNFQKLFQSSFIINCPGKKFQVVYNLSDPYQNYFNQTLKTTQKLLFQKMQLQHQKQTILVFLVGRQQLTQAKNWLISRLGDYKRLISVQTLHGGMKYHQQQSIINPSEDLPLKVVFTTNVAQSSLTVPNVVAVIDSGRQKHPQFSCDSNWNDMRVKLISKASVQQRAGRAGRTQNGEYYLIMTQEEFGSLKEFRDPQISHLHLGVLLLKFLKYGIRDLTEFPLLDQPNPANVRQSYKDLYLLDAIDIEQEQFQLTNLGQFILEVDLSPQSAKSLYHSQHDFGCAAQLLWIVSFFHSGNFLFAKQEKFDGVLTPIFDCVLNEGDKETWIALKSFFKQNYLFASEILRNGDIMQILFVLRQYCAINCHDCRARLRFSISNIKPNCNLCLNLRKSWTNAHQINQICLIQSKKLYRQISEQLKYNDHSKLVQALPQQIIQYQIQLATLASTACYYNDPPNFIQELSQTILKLHSITKEIHQAYLNLKEQLENSLVSGYYRNIAYSRKAPRMDYGYIRIDTGDIVLLHPSSQYFRVFNAEPSQYLLFYELVLSSRPYIKLVMPINYQTILRVASNWLQYLKSQSIIQEFEQISLDNFGPGIISKFQNEHRKQIVQLEKQLQKQGGNGSFLMIDYKNYKLSVVVPVLFKQTALLKINQKIEEKLDQIKSEYTFQQTFSQGVILKIGPGCQILSIMTDQDCLTCQIRNIVQFTRWKDLENLIKSTFSCQFVNVKRSENNSKSLQALIYFRDQNQQNLAEQALRNSPIPGINGQIFEMMPLKLKHSQNMSLTVRSYVPNQIPDHQIQNHLSFFCGRIAYKKFIYTQNSKQIFIRFQDIESARKMINHFPAWVRQRSNIGAPIKSLSQAFKIPNQLLKAVSSMEIQKYLEKLTGGKELKITVNGRKDDKIRVDYESDLQQARQIITRVIQPQQLKLTEFQYQLLKKHNFSYDERPKSFQLLNEEFEIQCQFNKKLGILYIYGLPDSRNEVSQIFNQFISDASSLLITQHFKFVNQVKFLYTLSQLTSLIQTYTFSFQQNQHNLTISITGFSSQLQEIKSSFKFEPQQIIEFTQLDCPICYQEIPKSEVITLIICGHQMHRSCLNLQINNQIRAKPFPRFPLSCTKCNQLIVQDDWRQVLSSFQIRNLYSYSIVDYMSRNPNLDFKWCENPTCQHVYRERDLNSIIRTCPKCFEKYCIRCKIKVVTKNHETLCYSKQLKEENKDDSSWVEQNATRCPNCLYPIEKNGGCNHVTCPRCKSHYCYLCGKEIDYNSPVAHFAIEGTPCHQKYLAS